MAAKPPARPRLDWALALIAQSLNSCLAPIDGAEVSAILQRLCSGRARKVDAWGARRLRLAGMGWDLGTGDYLQKWAKWRASTGMSRRWMV